MSIHRGALVFVPAVFLSAFLVFQIQPLISKSIVPWFGGISSVWTTCLLVFQSLLFAGYAYAHLLGRLSARKQIVVHVLLLVAATTISIVPSAAWKPAGDESPLLRIVAMLLATIGLPYFALSATGPLLQVWFSRACPRRSPYPLYAFSNAGSLLALISYPVIVEPLLSTTQQATIWRIGLLGAVALCAGAAWSSRRNVEERTEARLEPTPAPTAGTVALWIAWSACGVMLFMSVTNLLSLNLASVPFIWILPLSIYLLTFIITFSGSAAYSRTVFGWLLVPAALGLTGLMQVDLNYTVDGGRHLPILGSIAVASLCLFILCYVCHGELYRLKPAPRLLTSFYLSISLGGVVGGVIVAVVAPVAFLLNQELQVAMLSCCLLYLVATGGASNRGWVQGLKLASILVLALLLGRQSLALLDDAVETRRSFFGFLRVQEVDRGSSNHALKLFDGSMLHGYQFLQPELSREPTIYYSKWTGLGEIFGQLDSRSRHIGVIGLGVGTIASYGRPGDSMHFYEINPDVVDLATSTFRYLSNCEADWELTLGDARLTLEQQSPQQFDMLVLDAFSSDSIPVHLLTREAFEVYQRHLAPGGVVVVNASNGHLDLTAVLYGLAHESGLYAMELRNNEHRERLAYAADWMVLTRELEFVKRLTARVAPRENRGELQLANRPRPGVTTRVWTDRFSSLLPLLK